MRYFTSLKRLLFGTLIIVAGFYTTGKVDAQTETEGVNVVHSASLVKEKVDSVLSSQELTNSLLSQDWQGVVHNLTQDSANSADARAWLIIGHADLARNLNNVACAVFSTLLDSSSLDAWETWTTNFALNHPRSQVAHYLYGDALARNSKLDKAINEFTEAIRIDSTFYLAFNARGVVYALKWLETEGEDEKYYEKAREDFYNATILKPNWADAYANTGVLLIERGHAKSVNEAYIKAIKADSSFAMAYNGRSCALAKMDSIDEATHCLIHADSLLPGIPYVAQNARALTLPDDSTSTIARIGSSAKDSLGMRGTTTTSLSMGLGGTNIHAQFDNLNLQSWGWQLGINDTHIGQDYDLYRGGVYFNGIRASETGKPQKVGTDFMLAYQHGKQHSTAKENK